ncbi:T9SS type B sorting domain-containing protein [Flavobacterium marginilacus]|uniref:T9SS type B sorting domain-containing protein n=1 Tax=Flavobacterium marginilacus TaxID=3003256 RepID=UPI00248E7B63|nr:T9SS type B sorting domain-containing protein [Flavobacterium marginilacus]
MKHIYLLFCLFPLFVFSQDLSADYSIYPKTFSKIANVAKKSAISPFQFCDTDSDGIVSINLEDLKNRALDANSSQIIAESGIYIGTSSGEIQLVTNLTTNPSKIKVCSNSIVPIFDIAYNQNGDTYVSYQSNIYKINKTDCSVVNIYTSNVIGNINSLSFDRQSNIYFGGSSSSVYRLNNGNYNQANLWHDFVFGSAAGDFVMYGDKMYIAWNNYSIGKCQLYEVTVDNNMNYVSHKVLGNLPNETYGLASELGSLYGVTSNQLFRIKINSDSIYNEVILNNDFSSGAWYGAAGKNETVAFDVKVYETAADAQNQVNALPSTWNNTIPGGQTVYAVINNSVNQQSQIVPVDIKIGFSPSYTNPKNIEHCEFDTNASLFDINQTVSEIIGSQTNVTVSFHKSEIDAKNNSNPLPSLYTISGKNAKVYFRVTNASTGCFSVSSFDLIIKESPVFTIPKDISICDIFPLNFNLRALESEIIGNQSNLKVTFYSSNADALNNSNSLPDISVFNSNPNSIYFRVTNPSTGCFVVSRFNLAINQPPVFTTPKDISACGIFPLSFNLRAVESEIIGNQSGLKVAFYGSNADALNNSNSLPDIYAFNSNPNSIYFRVTNVLTGCFSISSFNLALNETPVFTIPKDISICDRFPLNFNFKTVESEIIGNQSGLKVTFYASNTDVLNNSNSLSDIYAFNSNPNSIYFRVTNPLTGCFVVSRFNLVINQLPVFTIPKDISVCGIFPLSFNLRAVESEIIGNQSGLKVTFYASNADALNNSNSLPDVSVFNSNPKAIFFRVTNLSTDCFSVSSFNLDLNETPVFTIPKDISICDRFPLNFNLKAVEPDIIGNQSNLKVTFYESESDALNNSNSLPDIYAFNSNPNFIYFRVTNVLTGCFLVSKFGFNLNFRAVFSNPKDIIICKSPNSNYKLDDFDAKAQEILNGQKGTYNIGFYNSYDDAVNKINEIVFPYYAEKSDNQIFFRIENSVMSSCFDVGSFFIYLRAESQNANIPFSIKTSDWKSEKNEIEILASGNYEYSMDGLTYQDIPVFKDLLPGEYQIFIRDKDNCSVIRDKVFLMMYRNFFTPNGDGINDYWNIIASAGGASVKIVIYDRYGKIMTSLKGDSMGWDGNYNNNPMPSSDYWFELITEEGKKLKGHFSLKR